MKETSFPRRDIKILLLEGVSETAVDAFRSAGYTNIRRCDGALPEDELGPAVAEAHIVGIRSRTRLTAEILGRSSRVFAIGCFCIGTDQVALDAAQGRG